MRNGGRGRKKDRRRDRKRKRGETMMRRKDVKINVNYNIIN